MATTSDYDAFEILKSMHVTAVSDTVNLQRRIDELEIDYAKDPWVETAAQLSRLRTRLEKRMREAQALYIAIEKF